MGRKKRRAPPPAADGGDNGDGGNGDGDNGDARPENRSGGRAEVNYADGEAERYHGCATVRRLQADLTRRALALMAPRSRRRKGDAEAAPAASPPPPPPLFLDLGCGSGLSGAELCARGVKRWVGLDVSPDMLALAAAAAAGPEPGPGGPPPPLSNPHWGDVVLADLGQGLPLRPGAAPAAVSISAVQWLLEPVQGKAGQSGAATANTAAPIDRFFAGLARCLLLSGGGGNKSPPSNPEWDVVAAIQAYGRDRSAALAVAAAARRAGFRAAVVADWPHRTRAVKSYALLGRAARGGDEDDDDKGLYLPPQCALVGHVDCGCSLWWRRRRRRGGEGEGDDADADDADDAWVLAHHRAAARRLCRLLWGAAARGGHLREVLSAADGGEEEQQQAPWLVATLDLAPPLSAAHSGASSCWGGLAVTVAGTARALERAGLLQQDDCATTTTTITADALAEGCRAAIGGCCGSGGLAATAVAAARLSPRAELEAQAERTTAVPEDVYEGARWWGESQGVGVMSGAADQPPVLFARAEVAAPASGEGGGRRLLSRLLTRVAAAATAAESPSAQCAPLAAVVIAREDGSALAAGAYYCCWSAAGGEGGASGGGGGGGDAGSDGASDQLLSPHVTAAVAAVRGDEAALAEALRPALEGLRRGLRED